MLELNSVCCSSVGRVQTLTEHKHKLNFTSGIKIGVWWSSWYKEPSVSTRKGQGACSVRWVEFNLLKPQTRRWVCVYRWGRPWYSGGRTWLYNHSSIYLGSLFANTYTYLYAYINFCYTTAKTAVSSPAFYCAALVWIPRPPTSAPISAGRQSSPLEWDSASLYQWLATGVEGMIP